MSSSTQSPLRVRFRQFELNLSSGELQKDGQKVPLPPKAFELLRTLVERPGDVVTRDELRDRLWGADTFVEFNDSLNHAVKKLRQVLGDSSNGPQFIETLPRYGYRFIAPVESASDSIEEQQPTAGSATNSDSKTVATIAIAAALVLVAGLIAASLYRHHRRVPALSEKDTVVLADFDNASGDPVFDDTLQQAVSISLNQSPFLNVLSESRATETLHMMGRPLGQSLTPQVARELCQRAGSKVYIAGSITTLGSQYVVGLKAVNCANGDVVAQQQATTSRKEDVLETLDAVSAKLRTELGESLATLQKFAVPLQQATTTSLEALRAYSLGRRQASEQGLRGALPYDQQAIQIDPKFAMGYFAVGYDYFVLGEVGRGSEYFTKAFELSNGVSEREKLTIAAAYYQSVTGELDKAVNTYKEQIATYPNDASAYMDLAIVYGQQGLYPAALDAAREAIKLAPDDATSFGVVSYDLIALQRFDEARQTCQNAVGRKLDDLVCRQVLYALAFLNDDSSARQEQAAWFMGKAAIENSGLSLEADTEAYFGHLRKARELTIRAVDSAVRNGHNENAAVWLANAALREAAFGNAAETRRLASRALSLLPNNQAVEAEAALALGMLGDSDRSTSLMQDLNNRFPLDTQIQTMWLPTIRSAVALRKRDSSSAALNELRGAVSLDLASIQFLTNVSCLNAVYLRGDAYLAAGNGEAAASEFQKILDHNGIVWNCWTGALAHLGVARANALQARTSQGANAAAARARAVAAYNDFFSLWKDADPDIPILKEAKAEFAKLQ